MNVPLSAPDINKDDINAVISVLHTTQLSIGPKVVEFEEQMAHQVGRRHGVAVNSGTSGLHLLVRAMVSKMAMSHHHTLQLHSFKQLSAL